MDGWRGWVGRRQSSGERNVHSVARSFQRARPVPHRPPITSHPRTPSHTRRMPETPASWPIFNVLAKALPGRRRCVQQTVAQASVTCTARLILPDTKHRLPKSYESCHTQCIGNQYTRSFDHSQFLFVLKDFTFLQGLTATVPALILTAFREGILQAAIADDSGSQSKSSSSIRSWHDLV